MARKTVKIPQKYFETKDEFQSFIENEKTWMFTRIVTAIRDSLTRGENEVKLLEARISETSSVITMKSTIDEWHVSLNLGLEWFIQEENYEYCAVIKKLISDVEEYKDGTKQIPEKF